MRPTVRKMLAILDGTPTGSPGQSLVELTLTLPILLIMLMGLSEIGWFANDYMILLDSVREAGRFGATKDPMSWADGEEYKYHRMDCEELITNFDKLPFENKTSWPGPDLSVWGYTTGDERPIGYYDGVACSVISNMAPLVFNDTTDDIAVSIFAYAVVNQGTSSAQVHVVGRYPSTANECQNDDQFDPFDWNHDGAGGDPSGTSGSGWDPGWDDVRGYVFRGNHQMDFGGPRPCLGSEFSTQQVEDMLNFTGDPDQQNKLEKTTNYGLVLVEIFWQHQPLFGFSLFDLGPLGKQTIHVWTFFPVSGAEPDLNL